jgi:folate-dependent phosphoribosylglycinamide formyltransferase PurN
MIKQFDFALSENETVSSLKLKIQQLEHEHFPKVIEGVILNSLD